MESTSPASKLIAAVSRRGFFGRAAVAGSAVLLGSSIPSRVGADQQRPPIPVARIPKDATPR